MINIAIDGPAGAGKSTIAKAVAKELDILYLDTGAMYRAFGLKALRNNIDTKSEEAVSAIVDSTDIEVKLENGKMLLFLDGEEVSGFIRRNEVSMAASDVSKYQAVRSKLVALQKKIASTSDMILDGRDIGTVVLPDTPYKFFLTADSHTRAVRRHLELKEKGEDVPVEQLQAEIEARDKQDMTRKVTPLKIADGAIIIDSSNMKIEDEIKLIVEKVRG